MLVLSEVMFSRGKKKQKNKTGTAPCFAVKCAHFIGFKITVLNHGMVWAGIGLEGHGHLPLPQAAQSSVWILS